MASRDIKRLNPGIQVDKLYVGAASKVNPYLVPETSEVTIDTSTFKVGTAEQDLDPTPFPFDSTSGSILVLDEFTWGVKGIDFDGSNESLTGSAHADFDFQYSSSYSLSAWIKTTDAGSHDAIITKLGTDDAWRGWSFKLTSGKTTFSLVSGGSSQILVKSVANVNDGLRHHLVTTYDGSTDASGVAIYIDGVSSSHTVTTDNLGNDDTTNAYVVTMGARDPNSADGYGKDWYDGIIAHVSVWDKELNQSEVTEIYNSGTAAGFNLSGSHSASGSLIGWWKTGDGDNGAGTDDSTAADGYIYDMSRNSQNMGANSMEADDIDDV
jgi:hypothetical protein